MAFTVSYKNPVSLPLERERERCTMILSGVSEEMLNTDLNISASIVVIQHKSMHSRT